MHVHVIGSPLGSPNDELTLLVPVAEGMQGWMRLGLGVLPFRLLASVQHKMMQATNPSKGIKCGACFATSGEVRVVHPQTIRA